MLNRTLETYLRCFASAKPNSWYVWLPWVELWYNTSYHTPARLTPFQVVYGREPPPLLRFEKGVAPATLVERSCLKGIWSLILDELKAQLLRAQGLMKKWADSKRRDVEFEGGHLVFLKIRPY